MSVIPTTQKALKIRGPGKIELAKSSPVPTPQADEVLVRVVCAAVNPVDGKSADLSPTPGATLGCDFSGEIVSIGAEIKKDLSLGDRVCGCVFGNNPEEIENGAFAEYVAVPGDLVFSIPPSMSFQEAATLGVGMTTVGMALYHTLKLPWPKSPAPKPGFVLVHGGGTATGTLAIQMIQMSGMIPVVTCSPRRFKLVKSLGAAEAFDYHSSSCGEDIRAYTENSLAYALDCITDTSSMKTCYDAIGSKGGRYVALDPFPIRAHTRRSIKPNWIIAFTIFNKPIRWQRPFEREAKAKDREFAETWFQVAQTLLNEGLIVSHALEKKTGGLAGVKGGVDRVRKGLVSGVKLVYDISTPLQVN